MYQYFVVTITLAVMSSVLFANFLDKKSMTKKHKVMAVVLCTMLVALLSSLFPIISGLILNITTRINEILHINLWTGFSFTVIFIVYLGGILIISVYLSTIAISEDDVSDEIKNAPIWALVHKLLSWRGGPALEPVTNESAPIENSCTSNYHTPVLQGAVEFGQNILQKPVDSQKNIDTIGIDTIKISEQSFDTKDNQSKEAVISVEYLVEEDFYSEVNIEEPEALKEVNIEEEKEIPELHAEESEIVAQEEVVIESIDENDSEELEAFEEIEAIEEIAINEVELEEPEAIEEVAINEAELEEPEALEEVEINEVELEEPEAIEEIAINEAEIEEPEALKEVNIEEEKEIPELHAEESEIIAQEEVVIEAIDESDSEEQEAFEEIEDIEEVDINEVELEEPEAIEEVDINEEPEALKEVNIEEEKEIPELHAEENEVAQEEVVIEAIDESDSKELEAFEEIEDIEKVAINEVEIEEPEAIEEVAINEVELEEPEAIEEVDINEVEIEEPEAIEEVAINEVEIEEPEALKEVNVEEEKEILGLHAEESEIVAQEEVVIESMNESDSEEQEAFEEIEAIEEVAINEAEIEEPEAIEEIAINGVEIEEPEAIEEEKENLELESQESEIIIKNEEPGTEGNTEFSSLSHISDETSVNTINEADNLNNTKDGSKVDRLIDEAFLLKVSGDLEGAIQSYMYALEHDIEDEVVFWLVLDICVLYKQLGKSDLAKDILESYVTNYGSIMNEEVKIQIINNL